MLEDQGTVKSAERYALKKKKRKRKLHISLIK